MQILILLFLFVPTGLILTLCVALEPFRSADLRESIGLDLNSLYQQFFITAGLSAAPLWAAIGAYGGLPPMASVMGVVAAYALTVLSLVVAQWRLKNALGVRLTAPYGGELKLAQLSRTTGLALLLQSLIFLLSSPVLYILYLISRDGLHFG